MAKKENKRKAPTKGKGNREEKRKKKKAADKDKRKRERDEDESDRLNATTTTSVEVGDNEKPAATKKKNVGNTLAPKVVSIREGGKGMKDRPLPIVNLILKNKDDPCFKTEYNKSENKTTVTIENKDDRESFVALSNNSSWTKLRSKAFESSKAPKDSGIIEHDNQRSGPWRIIFVGVSSPEELSGFGRDETSGRSAAQAEKKNILKEAVIASKGNTGSLCTDEKKEEIFVKLKQKKLLKPGQGMKSVEESLSQLKNKELRKQHDNPHGIRKVVNNLCDAPRRDITAPGHTKLMNDGKLMFVDGKGNIPSLRIVDNASRLRSAELAKRRDDRRRARGMNIPERSVKEIMKARYDKVEDTSMFEVKDTL